MELMQLPVKILVLLVLVLLIVDAETNPTSITTRTATSAKDLAAVGESKPAGARASSTGLKKVANPQGPRAKTGCRLQPSICYRENSEAGNPIPPLGRRRCCKNRCLDVSSDVNNCGFCGIRCPFAWQCCNGLCIDTRMNPFHCGNCYNQCLLGNPCFYGMCGYSAPFPPFPFPLPPRHPKPPTPISSPHSTPVA